MITSTDIITAASVGGTGGMVSPTKTTAGANTTAYVLCAQVTVGNGLPSLRPRSFRLWYSSSPFSYTAAAAVLSLAPTARWIDLPIGDQGGIILTKDSTLEALTGAYIYAWLETEAFDNPVSVSVKLQEIS